MSTITPERRRAVRFSRPDSQRWLTVMVVFSHRTFRWSLTRRTMLWILGGVMGFSTLAMIGSGYGFWATKKIMSFSHLQQETRNQQEQIQSSLEQAQALETELATLRQQHTELLRLLDPKLPSGAPVPPPTTGASASPQPIPPGTRDRISRLQQELDYTSKQAAVVRARMAPVIRAWSYTPSIPPTAGYLSSGFGIRLSPFSRGNETEDGLLGYHSGIDISNALDTPIQATADGEVVEAGWMDRYGNAVVIQHSQELETLYGHMDHLAVKTGQKVHRGDIIGYMGRTGHATGVHLHYEVRRNGKPENPQPFLRLQRQWIQALGKRS